MLLIFSLTLFVSASLLFLVQPMFTKMVLPLLGGSPAVWNTCMVFYQAALLAGYIYAHKATQWLGVRRQAVMHLVLLGAIILTLPIGIAQGWTPPATANPISWLFLLLLVSVGLPFFIISTTAPMLQQWFAHTGHEAAHDPYFLYGASNLGSMMALLGYPLLVEPYLRLKDQAWVWAGGYVVLTLLIGSCAVLLWRSPAMAPAAPGPAEALPTANPGSAPVTAGQRLWWVLLAFAPSSLLLGVTSYLSTDIASVPLLWVIPLAIYLLTFVLVFARKPLLSHDLMVKLQPVLLISIAYLFWRSVGTWPIFLLHLLVFFLLAMVCHGELMKYRPGASHLTEFYLWMSVGGVLGGLFNALVAPLTFKAVIEYPLMIVVACLLRPYLGAGEEKAYSRWLDFLLPLVLAAALSAVAWALPEDPSSLAQSGFIFLACLTGVLVLSFRHRPLRFGLGVGAIMLGGVFFTTDQVQVLYRARDFFGVHQVKLDREGQYHLLIHGSTLHGAQSLDPARRRQPLTYYSRSGPLGQVFSALSGRAGLKQVAIIGLGTGTIACYGQPGQEFTFYEIDPAVVRIAREPRFFTFLQDSQARVEVVLGDARLSLRGAPQGRYDLIILDAFSSDAIPVHLVTREALALYLTKLNQGGVLAFHISNKYLDLEPVLGNLAREAGLVCLAREDLRLTPSERQAKKSASHWVVLARDRENLGWLVGDHRWKPLLGRAGDTLWTDDFSNILSVFRWGLNNLKIPFISQLPATFPGPGPSPSGMATPGSSREPADG